MGSYLLLPQVGKLRPRERKGLVQGHMVGTQRPGLELRDLRTPRLEPPVRQTGSLRVLEPKRQTGLRLMGEGAAAGEGFKGPPGPAQANAPRPPLGPPLCLLSAQSPHSACPLLNAVLTHPTRSPIPQGPAQHTLTQPFTLLPAPTSMHWPRPQIRPGRGAQRGGASEEAAAFVGVSPEEGPRAGNREFWAKCPAPALNYWGQCYK